jgi:hypothetical protein
MCFGLELALLDISLLPVLRSNVFGIFNLLDEIVIQTEVFYGIAPDERFLYAVEHRSILNTIHSTLSLSTASSIFMFINRSTPLSVPL